MLVSQNDRDRLETLFLRTEEAVLAAEDARTHHNDFECTQASLLSLSLIAEIAEIKFRLILAELQEAVTRIGALEAYIEELQSKPKVQ
jgi:hypothetical protein